MPATVKRRCPICHEVFRHLRNKTCSPECRWKLFRQRGESQKAEATIRQNGFGNQETDRGAYLPTPEEIRHQMYLIKHGLLKISSREPTEL